MEDLCLGVKAIREGLDWIWSEPESCMRGYVDSQVLAGGWGRRRRGFKDFGTALGRDCEAGTGIEAN